MKPHKKIAATTLLAAMGMVAAGGSGAFAQSSGAPERTPVIRVTGEGTAKVVPDMAILTLGVVRQAARRVKRSMPTPR